jgi:chemotaxis protein histidine kinase CheA
VDRLDQHELFAQQVRDHAGKIEELLRVPEGECVPPLLGERLVRGTKLLWGSASIMGLESFKGTLQVLSRLWSGSPGASLRWTEPLARVHRELSGLEENLSSELDRPEAFRSVEEEYAPRLRELSSRIESLREEAEFTVPPASDTPPTTSDVSPAAEVSGPPFSAPIAAMEPETSGPLLYFTSECTQLLALLEKASHTFTASALEEESPDDEPVDHVLADLERRVRTLRRHLASSGVESRDDASSEERRFPFTMLEDILRGFVALRSPLVGIEVAVDVRASEISLDETCFEATARILENLISDGLERERAEKRSGKKISIEVEAQEVGGTIRVALWDSGSNSMTEGRMELEDCLAFYPSLRRVRSELEPLKGLLWVEPKVEGVEGEFPRFMFSLPTTVSNRPYVLLQIGPEQVVVPHSSLDAVLSLSHVRIEEDDDGRVACWNGHRIEVADLGLLHDELPLPEDGAEFLAVFGSVDRRVGMVVDGEASEAKGEVREPSGGPWSLVSCRCLTLSDGSRAPILDYRRIEHHIRLGQDSTSSLGGAGGEEEGQAGNGGESGSVTHPSTEQTAV